MLDYFAHLSPGAQIALGFGALALIACISAVIEERRDRRDIRAQIAADNRALSEQVQASDRAMIDRMGGRND